MLKVCACTCVCMILLGIGHNHSLNEIWVLSPRDDLIWMLHRVGAVQRILVSEGQTSHWQNLSLVKKLCVGPVSFFLVINFRDNEPLNLCLPSSFSGSGQGGETTCFCTSDIWLFYLEVGIPEPWGVWGLLLFPSLPTTAFFMRFPQRCDTL